MKVGFVTGINHFQNYPESALAGCVPDAETMQAILEGKGCSVVKMTDSQATDYNILNQMLEFYRQTLKAKSYYVGLAFSSHGLQYPSKTEADGLGEALCCHNLTAKGDEWASGFIKDKTFRGYLNRFPPYGIVEVWFDTCFSYGMSRLLIPGNEQHPVQNRFMPNPGKPKGQVWLSNNSMSLGLNSNIIMWTACGEEQTSADAYIDGGSHGAFTFYWAKAYRGNPKASRVQLLLKTREYLAANRFSQFPRLKCWNARGQAAVGE